MPKRSRERSGEDTTRVPTTDTTELVTPANTTPEWETSDIKSLAAYDIILNVSQAHHANCEYTEEQTRGLIRRPIASPVSIFTLS